MSPACPVTFRLVSEGVDPQQLLGIDIAENFFNVGFEIYGDKEKMKVCVTSASLRA